MKQTSGKKRITPARETGWVFNKNQLQLDEPVMIESRSLHWGSEKEKLNSVRYDWI